MVQPDVQNLCQYREGPQGVCIVMFLAALMGHVTLLAKRLPVDVFRSSPSRPETFDKFDLVSPMKLVGPQNVKQDDITHASRT